MVDLFCIFEVEVEVDGCGGGLDENSFGGSWWGGNMDLISEGYKLPLGHSSLVKLSSKSLDTL